jgi:alkaline phosphatase
MKKIALVTYLTVTSVISFMGIVCIATIFFMDVNIKSMFDEPVEVTKAEAEIVRSPLDESKKPKNIIIFIADGLGFSHLSAARAVLHGVDGLATWDKFSSFGWHHPHPFGAFVTDSAASATALATGYATVNGAVGIDNDGNDLETILEKAGRLGYRTGIVTDTYIWDATPAGFIAEHPRRGEGDKILSQIANSELDLIMGELRNISPTDTAEWNRNVNILESRFTVIEDVLDKKALLEEKPIAMVFRDDLIRQGTERVSLAQLTTEALNRLGRDEKPFVLLVESEEVDSASHRSDFGRMIAGVNSIESTLNQIFEYTKNKDDTLIVFTADHETGGLALSEHRTKGMKFEIRWASQEHTGASVPIMSTGPGSVNFSGILTNTQVGKTLNQLLNKKDL